MYRSRLKPLFKTKYVPLIMNTYNMKTVQSDSQRLSFNFKSHITMTNENKRAKSVIKVQERKMFFEITCRFPEKLLSA